MVGRQVGWLFGAGTSASAGVPTAGQLLDQFRATLFASENNLDVGEVRMGDPLVTESVRRYFDNAHGLPPLGDPDEYAAAFERAYPDPVVRRRWLDQWLSLGRPSFGHRVLATLMASGLVRWVATTNFDDLVEQGYEQLRARDEGLHRLTVAALDSVDRGARALREDDWPLLIKLHGDISSERLKNTTEELREQDAALRRVLLDASRTYGLAIIGYSGRDASVMETLLTAISQPGAFPHGLYWLANEPDAVLPVARELVTEAANAGVSAHFVQAANFDEAFGVLARHVQLTPASRRYVGEGRPVPRVQGVAVDTTEEGRFPALRLNALAVLELPGRALHIRCQQPIEERPQVLLRELQLGIPGIGIATGRDFYGFGLSNIWEQALSHYGPERAYEVDIRVDPVSPNQGYVGLLNEAIVRALAWDRPFRPVLRRKGHRLVVEPERSDDAAYFESLASAYESPLTGTFDGDRTWREGVRLRLEWRLGRVWLLFEPWTYFDPRAQPSEAKRLPRSRFAAPDPGAAWIRERWVKRRNQTWAAALGAWADLLVGAEKRSFAAPQIDNSRLVAATFTLARQTAYARPAARTRT